MIKKKKIDKVLNVMGLPCPTPTAMTSKTLKDMQKGKTLQVITNDMTTKETIPALCAKDGYELIDFKEENGLLYYFVCK